VLAGAFLPIVSIPLAVVLVTAMLTVHRRYGFFSVKLLAVTSTGTTFGPVGYEIILLYLAGLGALALGGRVRCRSTAGARATCASTNRLRHPRASHGIDRGPWRRVRRDRSISR
jgi:uncharacterized membrane protein YphA (DoxX/SURF4 family)